MKPIILFFVPLFLAACGTVSGPTTQSVNVNLTGVNSANCVATTQSDYKSFEAPATIDIATAGGDMKIDCKYNSRRRVVTITPEQCKSGYKYPDNITIDFTIVSLGSRYNGYQARGHQLQRQGVARMVTEKSYVPPVETDQTYPVRRSYYMSERSMPVAIN